MVYGLAWYGICKLRSFKAIFLESSSTTMKSAVFSSIITALVMKRYANVRTKYSLQNFQRISFLSLLRQLKLNITPFFLDFSISQFFSHFWSLSHTKKWISLLTFIAFELLWIDFHFEHRHRNKMYVHELMKMNCMEVKGERFTSATMKKTK